MNYAVNEPLQKTLTDEVELLERHKIAYSLIGELAASLRGQTRVTADVDIVMAIDLDRAIELIGDLEDSQFAPLVAGVDEIVQRSFILPIRHCETGVKVDLAVGLSGFERQAIERANTIDVGGCATEVVSAEDLIVMKVLAGRPQDNQDVRGILYSQSESFDWDYHMQVARELGEAIKLDLERQMTLLRESWRD